MGLFEILDHFGAHDLASARKATTAWASRMQWESENLNSYDSSAIYFMDVGVWAGGTDGIAKTSFGLVCEKDILLCSWLNLEKLWQWPGGGYANYTPDEIDDHDAYTIVSAGKRTPLSEGAKKFLRESNLRGRGWVMRATQASKPLTPPDQLVVIIPDLHLPLYAGHFFDRFQYKLTSRHPLVSLDKELRQMLDLALGCNATLIQVGDLYEVWESEILLRKQYRDLLRERDKCMESNIRGPIRADHETMIELGYVIPGWEPNHVSGNVLSDEYIRLHGVDFVQELLICNAIRKAHGALFSTQMFHYQIDGNHDNHLRNTYWSDYAPDEYRSNEMLCRPTKPGSRNLDYVRKEIGTGDRPIHIEHGHARDWHNCNRDVWKPGHGFDTVFTLSIPAKEFGVGTFALETADEWTDLQHYEMRLGCLRRADELFRDDPKIKVVIMGHTHSPMLASAPSRTSLLYSYPSHERYIDGPYWWKTDDQIRLDDMDKIAADEYRNRLMKLRVR